MMRSLTALILASAVGSAWGQMAAPLPGAANFQPAVETLLLGNADFPGGLARGVEPFLAGNTTDGFLANRNGFSGFAILLTQDTPFADLGPAARDFFEMGYDTLLPLYLAADEVLVPLAEPGLPVTKPIADAVVELALLAALESGGSDAALATRVAMNRLTDAGTLPGLE